MQKNWRDLIKPKRVEVDDDTLRDNYGKFEIEPLERGFGLTIGNSLRRILLSSIQGAAITSVKIDGVLHEFSSLSGVKEDVSDIILNLKGVKLMLEGEGTKVVTLASNGEGAVLAGDIESDASVKVLNPEHHIATVSKDGNLNCELIVSSGKGYAPAERNKDDELSVDMIPIDAIFQPVTKVNFNVSHARVGQRTDYDKLVMEISTTGAISPLDALSISAKILKDQLSVFISFEEGEEEVAVAVEDKPKFSGNLYKTVDEMELSVRSANCLKNADIKYIGEMVQKTDQEMLRTKNFGRKSLNEIKELLHKMSLDFGMKLENFPSRDELEALSVERKEGI